MDMYVSQKDEIWFLRVCHHISTGLYQLADHPAILRSIAIQGACRVSYPRAGLLSKDVPTDAGLTSNKSVVLTDKLKAAPCVFFLVLLSTSPATL